MRCSFCWQEKEPVVASYGEVAICVDCIKKASALIKKSDDKVVRLWGKNVNEHNDNKQFR